MSRVRAILTLWPVWSVEGVLLSDCSAGFSSWMSTTAVAWEVRRQIIGEEESRSSSRTGFGVLGCPGRVVIGEGLSCTHSAARGAGRHDRGIRDRAAQSGHRARLGRLMRFCELARLGDPPGLGAGVAAVMVCVLLVVGLGLLPGWFVDAQDVVVVGPVVVELLVSLFRFSA